MIGFCGALDFAERAVDFSCLRRMCGLHSGGCAFLNREFGILCDTPWGDVGEGTQPVTVKYNNSLYTAAIIMDCEARGLETSTARAILEGYFEEGEEYFRRLDFSYALALYDGRCGELMLRKGYKGDKPLFYTLKDGALYFASSIKPLIRLYGGCVRVSVRLLSEHILSRPKALPTGLFCDIFSLPQGKGMICSVFGQSFTAGERSYGLFESGGDGIYTPYPKKQDIRRLLTDALFAFGYPQFDCLMPSLLLEIMSRNKSGQRESLCVCDELAFCFPEYAAERAERLGRAWGMDIKPCVSIERGVSKRELRAMERSIDGLLDGIYADNSSVIHRIFDNELLARVSEQEDICLRIRQKAMLCQTQIWAESFNLVFV